MAQKGFCTLVLKDFDGTDDSRSNKTMSRTFGKEFRAALSTYEVPIVAHAHFERPRRYDESPTQATWSLDLQSSPTFLGLRPGVVRSEAFRLLDLPAEIRGMILEQALILPKSGVCTWRQAKNILLCPLTREMHGEISGIVRVPRVATYYEESGSIPRELLLGPELGEHLSVLRVNQQGSA